MGDIAQRGNRLTFAKGGRVGRPKKPSTHGKDVPTMAAEGGRIGLKKGGKPWGTGPKPGTHEYMMQDIHKRKGKAIGGAMKAGKAITRLVERAGGGEEGKPHSTRAGRIAAGVRKIKRGARAKKAEGGRIGKKHGFQVLGGGVEGKPHSTREGRDAAGRRRFKRWSGEDPSQRNRDFLQRARRMARAGRKKDFRTHGRDVPTMAAEGGRIGFKKGTDKKWIQKAVNPKHKGYCTPMTKKTCTPARKALARTFKKKAKTGWS